MMQTNPQADYQTLNRQLDDVLSKLQAPDVQVDEAVQLYEQGLKLITALETHLKQAENKIEQLKLKAAP
jgi:exodeoxyribonuclease VII small subunit